MKTLPKQRSGLPLLKRLGVAALVAVSLTVWAKPPPQEEDWGAIQLINLGEEPRASALAALHDVTPTLSYLGESEYRVSYEGTLTVECQGLIPGATYLTPAGTFKADRRGKGKATGKVKFTIVQEIAWWWGTVIWGDIVGPYVVEVVRLDPDGSSTPVLSGSFVPPQ